MGLKFELLLVALVVLTSAVTMTTKLREHNSAGMVGEKELEFTETTFTEVSAQKRIGVSFAVQGVQYAGVLKAENVRYYNDTIEELTAKRGTYKGAFIYLDGDVLLYQKEGFSYFTQHAYYNKQTQMLYTTPFVARRGADVMHGKTLRYNTLTKEAYATAVNAELYTIQSDKSDETNGTKE